MDPIANMIIQLKNAGEAGIDKVTLPHSKFKADILAVLKKEGFIKNFEERTEKERPVLFVELFLENRIPKIRGLKRISKSSKRIYKRVSDIRPVKNGYGSLILSTSKGVMSGKDAKREKLGGEALFSIW